MTITGMHLGDIVIGVVLIAFGSWILCVAAKRGDRW